MYVNCQGALAIEIWPGIFILKNLKVHQNQKNGAKQPNGYILSAYVFSILEQIFATCNSFPFYKCCFQNYKIFSILKAMDFDQSEKHRAMNHTIRSWSMFPYKTLRDIFVYRGVPRYDWRSAHLRVK